MPSPLPSPKGLKQKVFPFDKDGQEKTLKVMAHYIRECGDDVMFRQFASKILDGCYPSKLHSPSYEEIASCILRYVHENVRYVQDPPLMELVQSPSITLCVPGAVACIPIVDCDEMVAATLALMRAVGVDVQITLLKCLDRRMPEGEQVAYHVAGVFRKENGDYVPFDPSNKKSSVGFEQESVERTLIDPLDPVW